MFTNFPVGGSPPHCAVFVLHHPTRGDEIIFANQQFRLVFQIGKRRAKIIRHLFLSRRARRRIARAQIVLRRLRRERVIFGKHLKHKIDVALVSHLIVKTTNQFFVGFDRRAASISNHESRFPAS